mmetsp:Transcript_4932/g.13783  ORF Transcript_4932/g.13783 Transcript_4932/m.13783 type:complete len:223 (+) Transcript_4932:407-1075(+)
MTVVPAADGPTEGIASTKMDDQHSKTASIPVEQRRVTLVRVQSAPVNVPKPSTSGDRSVEALKRCPSAADQDAYEEAQGYYPASGTRPACSAIAESPSCSTSGATLQKLFSLFQPGTEFERQMLCVVRDLSIECVCKDSSVCNVDLLGSKLKLKGYQVWVRTTICGGSEWFKQLQHSFLLVEGDPKFPDQLYVVDPNFRDQFVIARQTPQYQRVSAFEHVGC